MLEDGVVAALQELRHAWPTVDVTACVTAWWSLSEPLPNLCLCGGEARGERARPRCVPAFPAECLTAEEQGIAEATLSPEECLHEGGEQDGRDDELLCDGSVWVAREQLNVRLGTWRRWCCQHDPSLYPAAIRVFAGTVASSFLTRRRRR